MKTVLQTIMEQKRQYEKLPLFTFMRDKSLAPRQRLAFYPCMAHFIMSFADLNRCILRREPTWDPVQQMVNRHTAEDDHHWPWYLEDFEKLGFDECRTGTEWMRILWSERAELTRMLSVRLGHLILNADAALRLVIIEAIEETGNVLFCHTAQLAEEISLETGVELRYCGRYHLERENGHAAGSDHRLLAAMPLDEEQRAQAILIVDEIFWLFAEWTMELLAYARCELARDLRRAGARLSSPGGEQVVLACAT